VNFIIQYRSTKSWRHWKWVTKLHAFLTLALDAGGQPHVLCYTSGKEPKYQLDRILHETRAAPNMVVNTEIPISLTEIKPKSKSLKFITLLTVLSCLNIKITSFTPTV
jgi:hypothetical protein